MLDLEALAAAREDRRAALSRLPLLSAWVPAALVALYLALVLVAGPRFMARRRAFRLTRLLVAYNALQVAANAYFVHKVIKAFSHEESNLWCQPVFPDRTDDFGMQLFNAIYIFYSLKILDFMDTVFFILRKKWNQVTFLHVYHHVCTMTILWTAVRFFPGGVLLLPGVLNACVHCVMYTYYLLAALHLPGAFLIKPYITTIQLVQFVFNIGYLALVLAFGSCAPPRALCISVVAFNLSLFFLFSRFYRSTYGGHREGHRGFVRKRPL